MKITVFLVYQDSLAHPELRRMLEEEPQFQVLDRLNHGPGIVTQVTQMRPDVVILDIDAREKSASDLIRQIGSSRPVIILSAHTETETILRTLRAGASGYLLRESAEREVAEAIRTVFAGHRYLSRGLWGKVIDDYVRHCEANGRGASAHQDSRPHPTGPPTSVTALPGEDA